MLHIDTSNSQHEQHPDLKDSSLQPSKNFKPDPNQQVLHNRGNSAKSNHSSNGKEAVIDESEMYSNKSLSEAIRERLFSPSHVPSSCEFLAANSHLNTNQSQIEIGSKFSEKSPIVKWQGSADMGVKGLNPPTTTVNHML